MRRTNLRWIIPAILFSTCSLSLVAEETRIDVRVISKRAKFIGTSMGGVEITIQDASTGKILANGKTSGTTGDTAKIMTEEKQHHAPVSTEDAAVFQTKLNLDEPRRLKFIARGPLAQPQATNTVTVTQWVVPGKHITGGDGMLLEMPGFVVDILSPPAHQKRTSADTPIDLRANVVMMCGCPIVPDGLWDANQFEVSAIVERDGKKISKTELEFAGETSQFHAQLDIKKPGVYAVTVYAYDPSNGNTGVDKTTFILP